MILCKKVREINSDRYNYSNDYDIVNEVKTIQRKTQHLYVHCSSYQKIAIRDCFDMISGTEWFARVLLMERSCTSKKRNELTTKGILDIVGRDQQDQKIYSIGV